MFYFYFLLFRYKRDQYTALLATSSLYNLLNASLLSETGPPLLDFEVLHMFFNYPNYIGFSFNYHHHHHFFL